MAEAGHISSFAIGAMHAGMVSWKPMGWFLWAWGRLMYM